MTDKTLFLKRSQEIRNAKSNNFMELHKLSGLDPARDYRFGDWSGIDFSGCDLEGFDFTGARLRNCNFKGATLSFARFDQAELNGSNLNEAKDWDYYRNNWQFPTKIVSSTHLPSFAIIQDAPFAPELVVLSSGSFMMGSKEDAGNESELPQHEVTIDYHLAVGRFAVTFEEWDFYCSQNPNAHKPNDRGWGRARRPVIDVSWNDAQGYVQWLSERTGYQYRLLSEAEWEYCCRAGTNTKYSLGDTITKNDAKFSEGKWESAKQTVPVGQFQPNDFGLYDMHGNVWEWCEDIWHKNYENAPDDGSVWNDPSGSDASRRVLRGGSWGNFPGNLRSANRRWFSTSFRNYNTGFRITRTLGTASR